jgi:mannose-6-phosphate isomerase-like protein (cupin superfamily)
VAFVELGADQGYEAPKDARDYVVVLPEDAEGEVVEQALALTEDDDFSVWTTGDHAGLPKRPTFTGPFEIEYTSLLTLEETGNKFSFNQFSLEPQEPEKISTGKIRGQTTHVTNADSFPDPVESENQKIFYVNEGHLSLKIEDEVRVAGEDTFVYIAPGNEYSIANFEDETVEAVATTVLNQSPFPAGDKLFPSPINPQGGVLPNELVSLGNEADFFGDWSAQELEGRHRIYGGKGDSELFATREDRLLGEEGNDILDASSGEGGNRLYGGEGNDELLVNVKDRAFGEEGSDLLDASLGSGHNLFDGGDGDDILIAGSNDQLVGGNGSDILNIRRGGDNLLYGGSGADQFRIVNGRLPDAVEVQYPEYIGDITPPGVTVPDLVDTGNTIADFELGVDKIHILGISDIASSLNDLELLPAFGDLGSTSMIAKFTEGGIEKEISLANVSGIIFNELSANDFVFA